MSLNDTGAAVQTGKAAAALDAGLRQHMLKVYNLMTMGLLLSGAVASAVAWTGLKYVFYSQGETGLELTTLGYVGLFTPLVMILASGLIPKQSAGMANLFFWAFCATFGTSLSVYLIPNGGADAIVPLLAAVGTFAGCSLYGYTTGRNLTGWGAFFVMGLFGLIGLSLLAILSGWSPGNMLMGVLGVFIFAGLTAYDTQRMKVSYILNRDSSQPVIVWEAISLYLNVVNLFARFFGMNMGSSRD